MHLHSAHIGLTPTLEQRRAIEAPLGPVLVVAGPGAGKTFCLTQRIQYLIQNLQIDAARVCAVTFTNKAAGEIAQRLRHAIGSSAEELTCGTLHSLCLTLLRLHPAEVGLAAGMGVADADYQARVLRRLRVHPSRHRQVLDLFGRHRLQHYLLTAGDRELFAAYQSALRSRNLVDFDDLVALARQLLSEGAPAADLRRRWDYVLVDEFQDLSLAQYEVVKGLSRDHRNCFAVGDDEQSIFSWTGADPHILGRFRDDFGIRDCVVLEQNRRCSRQIFESARRLVARNPALFDKRLEATRHSRFCVSAVEFEDERTEALWLIADIRRDRAECRTAWGEYGLLYRKHDIGRFLESHLLQAGIPCRLARGHALMDDEVVAYVLASVRLLCCPDDPLALEALAEHVLPRPLLDHVQALAPRASLLESLRLFASTGSKADADVRRAWRFIYHVGNLAALARGHDSLGPLVDELLAQRLGPYRNPLEEHASELSDPIDFPGASTLAESFAHAFATRRHIRVAAAGGLEIPIRRMLAVAGFGELLSIAETPGELFLSPGDARPGHWPLLVFKALQLWYSRDLVDRFTDYVVFDLETTELDVELCEVIEIAAVRVRNGVIVEQFVRLVRPTRPISARATAVHGYFDADVCEEPTFAEIWPEFRAFVGDDVLVAHNGQKFDVPVIRRLAAGLPGAEGLVFFDSLPLARSIFDESARLEDLARRFGVHTGRAHHALDDCSMLVGVLRRLGEIKLARARKACLASALGYLGLALALDDAREPTAEERLLRDLAVPATLGRYSNCLEAYAEECDAAGAPSVDVVVDRLGGTRVLERLRTERSMEERFPAAVARLSALVAASAAPTLAESIALMLARAALSTSGGVDTDPHRVSLLTLHSTKGLEFSRVYVVGAEDHQLPGYQALRDENEREIQEGRRLLYVGMTRAKDRLVLTRTLRREGRSSGGDLFLREAGLSSVPPPD